MQSDDEYHFSKISYKTIKMISMRSNRYILILFLILLITTSALGIMVFLNQDETEEIDFVACDAVYLPTIYLAVGESIELEEDFMPIESTVISASGNTITGLESGNATLTIDECNNYLVEVSDLYTAAILNNEKEYLPDNRYTSEENEYLDEILELKISEAGYMTRAAVLEAARFLLLRFPYKLNYFYENGRLSANVDGSYADGEGRYYHKGLYLSEDKYAELDENGILNEAAYWGHDLLSYEEGRSMVPNGLDCSGFICWTLYNGGYDPGDIGAGPSSDNFDLTDLGKMVYTNNLSPDDLKPGDLCGLDGHIGMIIGIDDGNIYIGEAYWVKDLQVRTYDFHEFVHESEWEYVILMDDYYQADGNLTYMW